MRSGRFRGELSEKVPVCSRKVPDKVRPSPQSSIQVNCAMNQSYTVYVYIYIYIFVCDFHIRATTDSTVITGVHALT